MFVLKSNKNTQKTHTLMETTLKITRDANDNICIENPGFVILNEQKHNMHNGYAQIPKKNNNGLKNDYNRFCFPDFYEYNPDGDCFTKFNRGDILYFAKKSRRGVESKHVIEIVEVTDSEIVLKQHKDYDSIHKFKMDKDEEYKKRYIESRNKDKEKKSIVIATNYIRLPWQCEGFHKIKNIIKNNGGVWKRSRGIWVIDICDDLVEEIKKHNKQIIKSDAVYVEEERELTWEEIHEL